MLEATLDRKISFAQQLMQRLDDGELLSNTLSQFKTLAGLENDESTQFLLDMLTYGAEDIPRVQPPFSKPAQIQAFEMYEQLCKAVDIKTLTLDNVRKSQFSGKRDERDHLIMTSVLEMERVKPSPPLYTPISRELANESLRLNTYNAKVQNVLARLRSFLYAYASQIWQEGLREKDGIQLLGHDYRIVTDSIGALDSQVADELAAALDDLRSENPAKWAQSALGCRNVVIKLGTLLWKSPGNQYESVLSERNLEIKGDREKNKISAYIDAHGQVADGEKKRLLEEAHKLVPLVFERGSKGKTGSEYRRAEAQELVQDTFKLVDLLQKSTELTPLESLPSKGS